MKFQLILDVTNNYIQELSLSICLCVVLIVCMSVCVSVYTGGGVYNKGWRRFRSEMQMTKQH